MIRTNDLILTGVGISVGILAIYLMKSKKQQDQKTTNIRKNTQVFKDNLQDDFNSTKIAKPSPIAPQKKEVSKKWMLSKGSTGKEVERLQIWLLRHHGWKGMITKVFDEQTETLVKKVFKKNHIDRAIYQKHQMGIPIHELIKT